MSIPILVLPSQWETTKTTTLVEQTAELGDGYTQYMSVGINPVKVEWQVKSPVLTRTKMNLVVSQLETFAGFITFSWSPDNGVSVPLAGYFCEEWEVTPYAPNAFMLEARFVKDGDSECIALASNTDTDLMKIQLEGMINFFNTYTRSTLPMVANAQGVTVNAFQTVEGRGGYFPNSVGTSESQALIIEGILAARRSITSVTARQTALNLALLYSNALIQYFYQEPIPTIPTSKIWLPHWLVNSKQSFISKGILRSKFINSGFFDVQVNFVNGLGILSSGNPNWGDKLSDVYRVYSVGGKLLWQNVYAPVSFGTEYPVDYWVSNPQLLGPKYRVYPTSSGNGGRAPLLTNEATGTIKLATNFTGTAIIVYASFIGAVVGINEPLEAFPITRPTQSNPKEKNHALDVSDWVDNAFRELSLATGDEKWNRAIQANIYSTLVATQVVNDSYLFKGDSTSTDPFSYPGTQLIIANNSSGGVANRTVTGWVEATVNDGPELYPVAELQNFAVVLQIETNSSVEMSFGCSVSSIMEIYLSLANNALDNTRIYTYYHPVIGGVDVNTSILPAEFIKYNTDNWWNAKIADNPIYTYNSVGSTVTTSIGLSTIDGSRRLVSTVNMNKGVGGFAGAGFVMSNVGNEPPTIYYQTTGSSVKVKIVDSLGQTYLWSLPNTGLGWSIFDPTWGSADPNINELPGDGIVQSVEIVGDANGSSVTKIWWIGDSPELLPFPTFTYKGAVVSRVNTAHTFKVGSFRGINSPLSTLKGSPGVVPFTANMIRDANNNYQIDSWRGMEAWVAYQSAEMWNKWGYSDRAQQVITLMADSQQAYARQNINNTFGPFAPAFRWPSWESGVGQDYNTWVWKNTIDPNSSWGGYNHRSLLAAAEHWKSNTKDIRASSIVMGFLGFIDKFYRSRGNNLPPSDYPEYVDPQHNYLSIQESALIARSALFANISGGNPSVTYRVFKKSIDFLMSEYVSTGPMAGTFTKSQPSYVENGLTISELFPFQQGEVMKTLASAIQYKDQITYPDCSVNLS